MDIKILENHHKESLILTEDNNKSPSCDLPRLAISISEPPNNLKMKSLSKKNVKRVTFSQNVTIVNIPSHKKNVRKKYFEKKKTIFDNVNIEDSKEQRCVDCNIF